MSISHWHVTTSNPWRSLGAWLPFDGTSLDDAAVADSKVHCQKPREVASRWIGNQGEKKENGHEKKIADGLSQLPGWVFLEINRWCGKSIGAKNRWNMAEVLWTMSWILKYYKYLGYFIAWHFYVVFFKLLEPLQLAVIGRKSATFGAFWNLEPFLLDALTTLLLFCGACDLRCSKEDARTSSHVDDTKSFESPMALWKPWSQPGLFGRETWCS